MEFGSLLFIFLFLPAVLSANLLKSRLKLYFLVMISLFFYYFYAGDSISVLLFSILLNYFFGIMISLNRNRRWSGLLLGAGITANVLLLAFYKYSGFIVSNIESLAGTGLETIRTHIPSVFPAGISFFTFVAVSYLVDVHRNRDLVFRDPVKVAFTLSFFPKVLSGPITFHHRFFSEMNGTEEKHRFELGVRRFVYGLGKKVLIADVLAKYADSVFLIPSEHLTTGLAWTGVLAFTLQIYIDFSGYTDMALGLGKMLGFDLPENFNFPYISNSIRDFWKRWHITLSNWLQLYIFLPVAYRVMRKIRTDRKFGFRVEDLAYFTASLITMLICGIWHGAEWTFVLWGLLHGIFLVIEHWKLGKFMKKKVWNPVRVFYTMIIVIAGWAVFRSPDIAYASEILRSMAGFGSGDGSRYFVSLFFDIETLGAFIAGILISLPLREWGGRLAAGPVMTKVPERFAGFFLIARESVSLLFFVLVFVASVMAIIGGSYSPFIYSGF